MKKYLLSEDEIYNFRGISARIKAALKAKGIKSITALNETIKLKRGAGLSHGSACAFISPPKEQNSFHNMTIEHLYVIADALDVTPDYLLGISSEDYQRDFGNVNSLTSLEEISNRINAIKITPDTDWADLYKQTAKIVNEELVKYGIHPIDDYEG